MHIGQAIYKLLAADVAVADITQGRIRTPVLKQTEKYPAIAFRSEDETADQIMDAPGTSGLRKCTFTFFSTVHGRGELWQAKELDEAIKAALQGFQGAVTNDEVSPEESLFIDGIFHLRTFQDAYDDKTETAQILSDFEVWYGQTDGDDSLLNDEGDELFTDN